MGAIEAMKQRQGHDLIRSKALKGASILGFRLDICVSRPFTIESREPRAESREPRAESREPRAESREPRAESREPRAESREPRAESREPRAESREPRAESREPRAESREPRAESREPRAESREPRAESREPRAESREPRAESREPRAESREPRADYCLRLTARLSLPPSRPPERGIPTPLPPSTLRTAPCLVAGSVALRAVEACKAQETACSGDAQRPLPADSDPWFVSPSWPRWPWAASCRPRHCRRRPRRRLQSPTTGA